MLSNQERELISKWHSERKLSIRCIARRLDVSRNTVRRWLHGVEKKNNPRSDCGQFLKRQSGEIEKLYAECEFRCPPLRRRIKEQYGEEIPLRMLQRFCTALRKEAKRKVWLEDTVMRFETLPGQHLQVDFGEKVVLVNGQPTRLKFFVCKMGYSRRLFAKAYLGESQDAWLDGMESAFKYFGGVPYCIVCDNASSLVRDHFAKDDSLKFTERFYHFLTYWGIKGIATAVRHPQSKGKVESGVKYIKVNSLVGIDKPDLAAWNLWLETWCRTESDERHLNTVFGGPYTPKERWKLEAMKLRPLNKARIANVFFETRKVGKDGLIRIDNLFYRVDNSLIGQELEIQHDETSITVLKGSKIVAILDKAKDVFNPTEQGASTQEPKEVAFEKQIKTLEKNVLWKKMQESANELNRSGFEYDQAINWHREARA